MRTTLDLPEKLIKAALKATRMKTKTGLIIHALESILRREKLSALSRSKGRLKLGIDLDVLRGR